jgi:glycosyltransferase involved in cell wall biosynthesis
MGRLINTIFFSFVQFFKLLIVDTDIVIFGTNPQFGYYIIPLLAFCRPKLKIAMWGFDLYPEAIFSDGIKIPEIIKKILIWWAGISYRCCELIVDIGFCMRKRLLMYNPKALFETIVPWALDEPKQPEKPDNKTRNDLFGHAKLGVLYSGTIGKAHQFEEFILLARELRKRNASVSFCFAGRGNCYNELQAMVTQEDSNISFAGFIDEELLPMRLAAADIHMISLRQGWEGIVVPSKFFGSLAAGKPLLYCGTPDSCIAQLIENESIGFIVSADTIRNVADVFENISNNKDLLQKMQNNAFMLYNSRFSRKIQYKLWDQSLRKIIFDKNKK